MDNMWHLQNEETYVAGENLWQRMSGPDIHIAITAASRRMAQTLMYLIAKGDAFGENQPVTLRLVDVPGSLEALRGFTMELMECGLPLLRDCIVTYKLEEAFRDVDVVFLLPYPKLTIQNSHKDKLEERCALYKLHGETLNLYAKKTVKVVVIGHAANTRTLICSRYAPFIPVTSFTALSHYVQNFATSLLSLRLRVKVEEIKDVIEWGNTTDLIFSDLRHATVKMPFEEKDVSVYSAVKNDHWIKGEFNDAVRKLTSDTTDAKRTIALSVAAVQHMKHWWFGTPPARLTSMIVRSDGSYEVPKGLFFSFPVIIKDKEWKIVQGLHLEIYDIIKINENIRELKQERDEAFDMCKHFWPFPAIQQVQEGNTTSDEKLA